MDGSKGKSEAEIDAEIGKVYEELRGRLPGPVIKVGEIQK